MLRNGDVYPPPQSFYRHPVIFAGVQVDIPRVGAKFLYNLQVGCAAQLRLPDGETFADNTVGVGEGLVVGLYC